MPHSSAAAAAAAPATATAKPNLKPMKPTLESRLAAVEAKLGILPLSSGTAKKKGDISSRIDAIKALIEEKTSKQFRDTLMESEKLMNDLDPGVALTHQQQQPLLYKRQEVLAASDSLQKDMEELQKILHLLLTSQPATSGPVREEHVTQAPIITAVAISPDEERRLDTLRLTLDDLNTRTQNFVGRMDTMLESYYAIMAAASEKCVLADETILEREMKQ